MAILLAYDFTTNSAPSTTAANIVGGTITNQALTSITYGSGLGYAAEPVIIVNPAAGATASASAVTNNSYFYFSIAPSAGNSISLTDLTFNIGRGGASTPRGYDIRSSADSYATTLGTADVATTRPTFTAVSISLAAASFQGVTGAVTFRVYIYAPGTGNSIDMDDVVVNGSVATSGTVEQEGFIFRNDNGTEITATSLAAQDVNIVRPINSPARLRVLLNSTLNRGAEQYRLEVKAVNEPSWSVVT